MNFNSNHKRREGGRLEISTDGNFVLIPVSELWNASRTIYKISCLIPKGFIFVTYLWYP